MATAVAIFVSMIAVSAFFVLFFAYVMGCLAAMALIWAINADEADHDAITFIPYDEAVWSWCFVLFCAWVFISTFLRK